MPDNQFPTAEVPQAQFPDTSVPWTYEKVYKLHQQAKEQLPEFKDTTLPQFSKTLNEMTQSRTFDAGLNDSFVKRASVGVDTALAKTGVPEALGNTFGGLGKLISPQAEDVGRNFGEGFLRGAADTSLLLGGLAITAGTGGFGAEVGIPMMAVGGGDMFAKTYTDTGSALAGAINVGANLALPGFAKFGAGRFASPLGKMLGSNLGAAANMELAKQGTSLAEGQGLQNPFTKEHAFEVALATLPSLPFQFKEALHQRNVEGRAMQMIQTLDTATRGSEERNALKTSEQGPVLPQDESQQPNFIHIPGEPIDDADVRQAQKLAFQFRDQPKQYTWMGKDLISLDQNYGPKLAKPLALLSDTTSESASVKGGAQSDLPPEAQVVSQKNNSPAMWGDFKQKVAEQEKMLTLAQAAVETPIANARDLEVNGNLANDIQKELEIPTRPVTDQLVQQKIEENTNLGLNEQESVERAAQVVQNQLNKNAGELQEQQARKVQKAQSEQEKFNQLPEPALKVAAQAITKLSKVYGENMDTDISDAWTKVSNKFFGDEKNLQLAATNPDEASTILTKQLQAAKGLKLLKRTEDTRVSNAQPLTIQGESGEIENPALKNLSTNGQAAAEDLVRHEDKIAQNGGIDGQVTIEEAATARIGKPVDDKYVARINALMREFTAGTIRRVPTNKGWKFQFDDVQSLKKEFGDISNTAIMDFARDNHDVMARIIQKRLSDMQGADVQFASWGRDDSSGYRLKGDRKLLNLPGTELALPITAKTFFQEHFLNRGETPQEADRLSDIAMTVSAAYREIDKTRVTDLVDKVGKFGAGAVGFAQEGKDLSNGAIGINTIAQMFNQGPKEFRRFMMLHVLAHEMYHRMEEAYNLGQLSDRKAKVFEQMSLFATEMPTEDRAAMLSDLFNLVVPKGYRNLDAKEVITHVAAAGAQTPSEFMATLSGLFTLGAARPGRLKGPEGMYDYLLYTDKQISDFANMQYLDLTQLGEAMHDFYQMVEQNPKKAESRAVAVKTFIDGFKTLLSSKAEIEDAVNKVRYLQNYMEGGYQALVDINKLSAIIVSPGQERASFSPKINVLKSLQDNFYGQTEVKDAGVQWMKSLGLKDDPGKPFGIEPNWYERVLQTPAQLAEQYPVTRPIIDLVMKWQSIGKKHATMASAPFMSPDKNGVMVLDPEHSGITKILNSEKLNDAISKLFLEQNARKVGKLMEDGEMESFLAKEGVTGGDADLIIQTVKNTSAAMKAMGESILNTKKDQMAFVAGRAMMSRAPELSSSQAMQVSTELTEALLAKVSGDPVAGQQADVALQKLQAIMTPEVLNAGTSMVQSLMGKYLDLANSIQSRPEYTPEARLGRYYLRYTVDKAPQSFGVETREQLSAKIAEAQKVADPDSIQTFDKFDKNKLTSELYGPMAQKFTDFETAALENLKALAPEDAALFEKIGYTPGDATFKEIAARGFGKYLLKRKLVGGREELNMMEGVLDYISGVSSGLARSYTKDLAMLHLADPTMKANPKIKNLMAQYVSTNISPPAKEWTFFKNAAFQFFMAGNMSSLLVEKSQPLFTLVPHLTQNGASIAGSYGYLAKAMNMLSKIAGDGKGIDPQLGLKEALERGNHEGVLDFGVYQQLVDGMDVEVANLRKLTGGSAETVGVKDFLSKPVWAYMNFMRNLYTKFAGSNGRISFVAGYLLAKDKGLDNEQAYNFATRTTRVSQGGGGAAARPIGLFANTGKLYPAVGLWYTLKHYTTSTIGMMYRLSKDSIAKQGLSPAEVTSARKALGQMVATQVLMTGALGLPFLSGTLSLLEQVDPNLQAKKAVREGLASLGGDDKELGELISDAFLHGAVPRMIPGLSSVDVSGRLGLGDAFGIDPNYGITAEGLFGAPGSLMVNLLKGGQNAFEGKFGQAAESVLPTAMKNVVRAYNDDWSVRDAKGNLLLQPSDTENILAAVGLRPKRLSELKEEQALLMRSNEIEARQMQQFHSQLADILLSGDPATVRSLLVQRHQEDPFYDPRTGLRLVVQAAQDKTVPIEPRDKGPRGNQVEREDLSSSFSTRPIPSELALLQRRKEMERSVGIAGAGRPSRSELTMAQMVDQLRAQNPTLSRVHAQAIVSRQLAPRPEY